MRKIKNVEKTVKVIEDITCDICNNTCKVGYGDNYEYLEINASWGFYTKGGKDGQVWNAQICEDCVDIHLIPLVKFDGREYSKQELRKMKINKLNK